MTTRISDVFDRDIYQALDAEDSIVKTSIFQSGMVTRNQALDFRVQTGETTQSGIITLPYWKDLGDTEANVSNDDPTVEASIEGLGMDNMVARVSFKNKVFGAMDLVDELSGGAPMQRIRNRFGAYWTRQFQSHTIATLEGVLANNVANDGGDMLIDVSGETASGFDSDVLMEARLTLGDSMDQLNTLIVHPVVYGQIHKEVETVYDEILGVYFERYAGMRVIVNQNVPVEFANGTDSTGGFNYTSYVCGAGALGYGVGTPAVPVEDGRKDLVGNGSGMDYIIERNTFSLHPIGHSWAGAEGANASPTIAQLADAASWTRKVDRQRINLAFIKTKK